MSERRREDRNPCFMRAEIILENTPPIEVEVHDISEHGLRIVMPNTNDIPNEFLLSIPRRHFREVMRVRRRTLTALGCIVKRFINNKVA